MTVGRTSFQKNYVPLYRALDRILADPESRVFFGHAGAGSVDLVRTLHPEVQKRCRAFDHLAQVEHLLFAADGFILTSRYEGLALSVLQAICCGLKIFVTRVLGNTSLERIGFRDITWIVPSEDGAVLAENIERELRPWLANGGPPPDPAQLDCARRNIASRIQLEKVYRVYRHFARSYSP